MAEPGFLVEIWGSGGDGYEKGGGEFEEKRGVMKKRDGYGMSFWNINFFPSLFAWV